MSVIHIVGAGAIGGVLAARLWQAGSNVCLLDNDAEHVRAINTRGLKICGAYEALARVPAIELRELDVAYALRNPHPAAIVVSLTDRSKKRSISSRNSASDSAAFTWMRRCDPLSSPFVYHEHNARNLLITHRS